MSHPVPADAARGHHGAVDIRVLGGFSVSLGGNVVRLTGRRSRGLLALLASRPGQPVTTSEVLHQVWGEATADPPGESARNTVQARVSALRRAVGPDLLRAVERGYVLDLPPDAVDVTRFERAVRRARELRAAMEVEPASEMYAHALGQWRGDRAYSDLQHVPALVKEADRLAELRLQVLQEWLALEIERGRYDEVAEILVDATGRHPGIEELWALRMLGLYGQGRQAEASEVYVEARRQLRERFGLDPSPRLRELELIILHQKDPRRGGMRFPGPVRIARPATSFVGRQDDLDEVAALVASARLLTLTGPGGVGKTRLAMEATQVLVDSCAPVAAHGVTVVDLIEYRRGDDLAGAVLEALGPVVPSSRSVTTSSRARRALDMLCDVLADRRLLLILDNCEHLTEDVAVLTSALLNRTTATHILATSREALNVPGESVYVVDPLHDDPAVRLFLDRVRATQPDLQVDDDRRRTVTSICRQLDGLPLAMELAAVRIRVLGIDEVARLLDDRFSLLSHGARMAAARHRTLEAVIDWSYDLLDEGDRRVFEALSVFRGSFAVRHARQVCVRLGGSETQAMDSIERLVSRSMVQAETGPDGSARLRLLETMRAYAAERLRASGLEQRAVVAHAQVYVELAREQMPALTTERQARAVAALMRDDSNIRAAHNNAVQRRLGALAQEFVGVLGYVAWMREGRAPDWGIVVRSLDLPARDVEIRVRALAWATHLGSVFGHADEAVRYGEQAARLASVHPDCRLPEVGFALLARAHALHRLGRWEEGDAILGEAREVSAATGDPWTIAGCAMVRGLGALVRGRLAEADENFIEAANWYRACPDRWGQQRAALRRAIVGGAQGDHAGAALLLREALAFLDELELPEAAISARVALARATLFAGDVETARGMVETLERGGIIGRFSEVDGRVLQCRAVLAEHDGAAGDAVELHLGAARRLLDAGLSAEAIESLARVILLTGRDDPAATAAAADAAAVAAGSADPRVRATGCEVAALVGTDDAEVVRQQRQAQLIRDDHGLARPALLRDHPWLAGATH
ncbi:BTAD domain-containing putative transcriptional regulator [Phytoactinopolyspora limicola]|uniref:BTAD domain-containing putative transcriptional regulator n=1 Tax=Phytoactinopolyspora limicola TaxID=2715536 RepID=UPI00140C1DB9|nr:BTAD domain-containing putative transcriptional regulator [Phytoactinopolyspora limicola]